MRGGHQMCIDPERGTIFHSYTSLVPPLPRGVQFLFVCAETLYMFGGWDGTADLCDLWQFSVKSLQWACLSANTSQEVGLAPDHTLRLVSVHQVWTHLSQGGPSSRSCHKMCLDHTSQQLYLLGRYLSPTSRTQMQDDGVEPHTLPVGYSEQHSLLRCVVGSAVLSVLQGDFYSYSIPDQTWQLLSTNTHAQGGPHLLYDHQMAFDQATRVIYVFGGRVLTS